MFIIYQPPRLPPPPDEPPRLPPPIEPPLLPPELIVPPLDLDDELLRVVVVGRELREVLLTRELLLEELLTRVLLPRVIAPFLLLMVFRVDILVFAERLRLFCSTVLLKFELAGNALLDRLPMVELLRLELLLKVLFLP
jgi:hypothetical protein